MLPLKLAVCALIGAAVWKGKRPGIMTPDRDRIYRECLNGRVPTETMREVADAFEKVRCYPQARLLRQRIALRELPKEEKAKRRAWFRKAMKSKNKAAVLKLADAFESQGSNGTAQRLREYASGLPERYTPPDVVTPAPVASDASDSASDSEVGDTIRPESDMMNGASHGTIAAE